jgi:uncharacterized protein YjbJ (UPF0337 family)
MNWDRIEGEWKQRRGKAVHHWGKMMNDELAAIAGKYEELVGKLQEKYGIASDRSKQQLDDFKRLVAQLKRSNARLTVLQARLNTMKSTPARKKTVSARGAQARRSRRKRVPARDVIAVISGEFKHANVMDVR